MVEKTQTNPEEPPMDLEEAKERERFRLGPLNIFYYLFAIILGLAISSVFLLCNEYKFQRENIANLKHIIRALQE